MINWKNLWKSLRKRRKYWIEKCGYGHVGGTPVGIWNRESIQQLVEKQLRKDITSDHKIEKMVNTFVSKLQWDLRWSYNSSSCLNNKQVDFLKECLRELLTDAL